MRTDRPPRIPKKKRKTENSDPGSSSKHTKKKDTQHGADVESGRADQERPASSESSWIRSLLSTPPSVLVIILTLVLLVSVILIMPLTTLTTQKLSSGLNYAQGLRVRDNRGASPVQKPREGLLSNLTATTIPVAAAVAVAASSTSSPSSDNQPSPPQSVEADDIASTPAPPPPATVGSIPIIEAPPRPNAIANEPNTDSSLEISSVTPSPVAVLNMSKVFPISEFISTPHKKESSFALYVLPTKEPAPKLEPNSPTLNSFWAVKQDPTASPSPTFAPVIQATGKYSGPMEHTPKYLFVASTHGSVSNQLISLINGAIQAKRNNLTLVMPPAFSPGGGNVLRTADGNYIYLIGTFFNYDYFVRNSGIDCITMEQFYALPEGHRFLSRDYAEPVPFFMVRDEDTKVIDNFYQRGDWRFDVQMIKDRQVFTGYTHTWHSKCRELQRAANILPVCPNQYGDLSCRLILLDSLFTNYFNCSKWHLEYEEFRKYLKPVDAIQKTVDEFMGPLKRPVVCVHVRFMGKFETSGTYLERLMAVVQEEFAALKKSGVSEFTVHVMGMRNPNERFHVSSVQDSLRRAFDLSLRNFTNVKTELPNMANIGSEQNSSWLHEEMSEVEIDSVFGSEYGMIVTDQWICTMSDVYIGRGESTFSQFVRSWRAQLGKKTVLY